jgi:gluconate 2-dehydrogenase gamma chain
MSASHWKRRKFLSAGVSTAATLTACRRGRSPWRFFALEEAFLVEQICQQLIPADQDPGAREAGVVNYIDRQLAGFQRRQQSVYRRGLALVDDTSRAMFQNRFTNLDSASQIAVLTAVEKKDQVFFNALLAHSMQGFYGNPRHGGNRDYASWRMLGVPPIPVRGRQHYDLTGRRS